MKTGKWFAKIVSLILVFIILSGSSALAGWQKDGGKWWYSYENGGYARNTWLQESSEWYYFGDDGYMATGWINDGGAWYYLDQTGAMVTGWQKIGSWYHFDSSGKMDTGWINEGGIWFYLDRTGVMATGWQEINGAWYYFDASGRLYTNAYIDQQYFVDINGQWDGVNLSDVPATVSATDSEPDEEGQENQADSNTVKFTFQQDGWYIARLEVQVWDKSAQDFTWMYSDSRARGQKTTLSIDPEKYEVNRVGYQIWFFGWDNDYMNIPWANTDFATDFLLSGYGDYPDFTWK